MKAALFAAIPVVQAANAAMSAAQMFESLQHTSALQLTAAEQATHFENFNAALSRYSSVEEAFHATLPVFTEADRAAMAEATYKFDLSRVEGLTRGQVKNLFGTIMSENFRPVADVEESSITAEKFPANFFAAQEWPECASIINLARDQGNCGSCWAMGTVAAVNDRLCIASKGKNQNLLSTNYVLTCSMREGCDGGQLYTAINFMQRNGVPTGGEHEDEDTGKTCQPYYFHRCAHHMPEGFDKLPECNVSDIHPDDDHFTPKCEQECSSKKYPKTLAEDKVRLAQTGTAMTVKQVKEQLMQYGSVAAAFYVYPDFLLYTGGVYSPVKHQQMLGGHAIKVIGWGTDEATGEEYWEVVNSWNEHWGIDEGHIKMSIKTAGLGDFEYGIFNQKEINEKYALTAERI